MSKAQHLHPSSPAQGQTINHVSMQGLASFVILLAMSPLLLVLVVVSMTYLLSALLAVSGILG